MLAATDPRHGTANGYKNLACRCDACREAWRIYHAEMMHRLGYERPRAVFLAERYPEPPPHGTETRYGGKWRCRCDECREAARLARARRRAAYV
jgi:hypothetical protein